MKGCVGFGEREGVCGNAPDLDLNHSGLFCTGCEQARRANITEQMAAITQSFEEMDR